MQIVHVQVTYHRTIVFKRARRYNFSSLFFPAILFLIKVHLTESEESGNDSMAAFKKLADDRRDFVMTTASSQIAREFNEWIDELKKTATDDGVHQLLASISGQFIVFMVKLHCE